MPSHRDSLISPYTVPQLFALVADIERYPEFLPWCRAARVKERNGNNFLGELVIAFKHLTESYTSRVELMPPANEGDSAAINVNMVEGPFDYLVNEWRFTPVEQGTKIDLMLDFKFKSRMLEMLMGGLFSRATMKMVSAFNERADELYGKVELA